MEYRVSEIAYELLRVPPLEIEGCIDGGFDALRTGDLKQNHGMALLLPECFEVTIAGGPLHVEALARKRVAQQGGGAVVISR